MHELFGFDGITMNNFKKGTEKRDRKRFKNGTKNVILQRRSSSAIGYDDDNYAEDAAILSYLDSDSQAGKVDNRYGGYR